MRSTFVALEDMPEAVLLFARSGRVTAWNRAFGALTRLPDAARGGIVDLDGLADLLALNGVVRPSTARGLARRASPIVRERRRRTFLLRLVDGRVVEGSLAFRADGGCIAQFRDATSGWRVRRVATQLAFDDPLTGLANRRRFRERIEAALHGADDRDVAVLVVELDRFKTVNDTLGQAVGDALLRAVAGRLRSVVRNGDTVARLGGDEFGILMPQAPDPLDRERLGWRLVDLIGRTYLVEGHTIEVGASVGLAVARPGTRSALRLQQEADSALDEAKRAGRGRAVAFDPAMEVRALARQALDADLRRALPLRQFELHYQPQFADGGRRLKGFEALVRWRHPERGMMAPGLFVPFAEETGLIGPIGSWVMASACAEAARWPEPLTVSVNLSPVQFLEPDLEASIKGALARSGLSPARLVLEITETALLHGGERTRAVLARIKRLGVRIAMDDFGTGYASLSYLHRFGFDELKLDGSFVRALGDDVKASAIVETVARLGASLGLVTVAEGVETAAQMARVNDCGYGAIQGFHLGRPMPAALLDAFLAAQSPRAA